MSNPFELFGLEPSFRLDLKALDAVYFRLQKHYHPDKMDQNESSILLNSSTINAAYQVLKNPVKRAETLLSLLGIPIPGQHGETAGTEIMLLDVLEFQETLMMCEDHEESLEIMAELEESFNEEQHLFAESFDHGNFDVLPDIYVKLSYLDRLRKQVIEVEEQFFKRKAAFH